VPPADVSYFTSTYLFTLCCPAVPATIVSTVECSYPVPQDASVGFLYIGANVAAIPMTFIGKYLDCSALACTLSCLVSCNRWSSQLVYDRYEGETRHGFSLLAR
jgi:hypothetical protein